MERREDAAHQLLGAAAVGADAEAQTGELGRRSNTVGIATQDDQRFGTR